MAQSETENQSLHAIADAPPHGAQMLEIRGALERRAPRPSISGTSADKSKLREVPRTEVALRRQDVAATTPILPASAPAIVVGTPEEKRRCDALIEAGDAKNRSGDHRAAQEALLKAAELADAFRDQERLARIAAALPAWHWPEPGQSNPLALLLAQRALSVEEENGGRRAILMARIAAESSYFASRRSDCRELAACAFDLAAGQDQRTELQVRLLRDPIMREPERAAERLHNAEEIVRIGIEVGDYAACFLGGLMQTAALAVGGKIARAHQVAEATEEIVSVSGSSLHKGVVLAWKMSRAAMEGRFAEAEQAFDRCAGFAAKNHLQYLSDACWPAMLLPLSEAERIAEIEHAAERTVERRPGALVFQALLSWIKIRLGKSQDSAFLLDRLAADDYAGLSQSDGGWIGMAALAEVCVGLNRPEDAGLLYKLLLPYGEYNAALNAFASFGSTELYLGELASVMGRYAEAARHFEKSLAYNRRIGARPWAAYSRWGLARSLFALGGAANAARADEMLEQLEGEAGPLRMKRLVSRIHEFRGQIRSTGVSPPPRAQAAGESRSAAREGARLLAPERVRLESEGAAESRSAPSAPDAPHKVGNFHRNGDIWELGFHGRTFWLRHCRGFEFIHFLLSNAGREFGAMEVVHQGRTSPDGSARADAPPSVHQSAGPILDAQAKQAYRARIKELAEDLEDAREANDVERAEKIEQEKEFLARELARALGLFDRDRKFNAESDRARKCVRMAISRALSAISRRDEEFGQLLARSVRTGNLSSFVPRVENTLRWRL